MKNLLSRTITGVTYAAIILAGILWNKYSFGAVLMFALTVCLFEFYDLVNIHKNTRINAVINSFGGLMLFLSLANLAFGATEPSKYCLFTFLAYIVVVLSVEIGKHRGDLSQFASILFGHCYITLPISLLYLNTFQDGNYSFIIPLALFTFIWTNDTFAYLIGITFGRHRLFERISPKKTWEGFFGGLIFTLACSLLFARFCPAIPAVYWLTLSLLTTILATLGDLAESFIKRTLKVKDSGTALPGHGGFLDRFDSLLFAAYAIPIVKLLL
ncbi:MAG: phosphatidate cytidylyltransferase [Dysgonamonadaceae bacterium]|jgi:phosphatidate cytidylyltransferase|nr:phosphatidate cytidylyltransferase [Dysgonamonadaceae bacterium]